MQTEVAKINLHPIYNISKYSWAVLIISILLTIIEVFLKMQDFVGGWHIVGYFLILLPLMFMVYKGKANRFIKWVFPLLFVMIFDMFFYSNNFVQKFVPIFFYLLVITLYMNSMQKIDYFYQTFVPYIPFQYSLDYIAKFFINLFEANSDNSIYKRVGIALLITAPFLLIFGLLLSYGDIRYFNFIKNLFNFHINFEFSNMLQIPIAMGFFLFLFVVGFSYKRDMPNYKESKAFDILIVGIFLSAINLLFFTFIITQVPNIFGTLTLPKGVSLSSYAREGFFQLMVVMLLVILIYSFIIKRFKGETTLKIALVGLLVQTIIIGISSIKKMHLYQDIMGATVLRYYVEWFDYFLIIILALAIFVTIKEINFRKFLSTTAIISMVSFGIIISINIDGMVASNNIAKFKNNPSKLDKQAISNLSIDALPYIQDSDIKLYLNVKRDCTSFREYHFGYCRMMQKYGSNHILAF